MLSGHPERPQWISKRSQTSPPGDAPWRDAQAWGPLGAGQGTSWSPWGYPVPIALLFGVSGPSWGSFWGDFGAQRDWAVFGRLRALFGTSCEPLPLSEPSSEPVSALSGASWGPLGALLRPSWAVLKPSWEPLGPSWDDLWGLLARLGQISARKAENPKHMQTPKENQCF